MMLAVARGVFLVGALAVAALCGAVWSEPDARVVQTSSGLGYCPLPANARVQSVEVRPDKDLLLLMYGLSQGKGRA